jgi:hypothetical protein
MSVISSISPIDTSHGHGPPVSSALNQAQGGDLLAWIMDAISHAGVAP